MERGSVFIDLEVLSTKISKETIIGGFDG